MRYILILLLLISGSLSAQFNPTSAKTKFVNGLSIGSKDSTYFTNAGDTVVLYIGRDSAVYARYKGYHRKLAYFNQVDTSLIFNQVVRTFGDQTIAGNKTFTSDIRINNGVGDINVGEELVEALSTGLVSGGALSTSSSTTYNIAAGAGHVINNVTKRYKQVTWSASNNRTPSISNVQLHVLVDSLGNFVEQSTIPTRAQRRSFIYLGYVSQVGTTVNAATSSSQVISQPVNQSYDFFDAYGPFNVSGNIMSAAGANLQVNKTSGSMFKAGSNFQVDPNDPNVRSQTAKTPIIFKYATQTTVETNGRNTIDPTTYDNSGTATTIGGSSNQATIQRVWLFPSDTVRIQYGQTIYSSLSQALTALQNGTDVFVPNNRYPSNAELLGYIVVTKGATALNDPTNARVLMNILATTGTAVAGAPYWGDILGSLNNQTDLRDTLALRVDTYGTQTVGGSKTFSGITAISNTTASSSSTTGALTVAGGLGVSGAIFSGSAIFSGTNSSIVTGTGGNFLNFGTQYNFSNSQALVAAALSPGGSGGMTMGRNLSYSNTGAPNLPSFATNGTVSAFHLSEGGSVNVYAQTFGSGGSVAGLGHSRFDSTGSFRVLNGTAFLKNMANGSSSDSVIVSNNGELRKIAQSSIGGGLYLPLSGGTLTGALNGTSAAFSGNISTGAYLNFSSPTATIGAGTTNAGWLEINSGTNNFNVRVNGGDRLHVTQNGNTLIKTTTDNGTDALQVAGSAAISSLAGTGDRLVQANSSGQLSATQAIASGTYTPTATELGNASSISVTVHNYSRVGNIVTVSGKLDFTTNTTSGLSAVYITLPIATSFPGSSSTVMGTATDYGNNKAGRVTEGTSNRGAVFINSPTTSGVGVEVYYTFQYIVQ